jgi:hypothetical protein
MLPGVVVILQNDSVSSQSLYPKEGILVITLLIIPLEKSKSLPLTLDSLFLSSGFG